MLVSFFRDEQGLATVEYALLVTLVVCVCLATWIALGAPTRLPVETAAKIWPTE